MSAPLLTKLGECQDSSASGPNHRGDELSAGPSPEKVRAGQTLASHRDPQEPSHIVRNCHFMIDGDRPEGDVDRKAVCQREYLSNLSATPFPSTGVTGSTTFRISAISAVPVRFVRRTSPYARELISSPAWGNVTRVVERPSSTPRKKPEPFQCRARVRTSSQRF